MGQILCSSNGFLSVLSIGDWAHGGPKEGNNLWVLWSVRQKNYWWARAPQGDGRRNEQTRQESALLSRCRAIHYSLHTRQPQKSSAL